MLPRHHWIKANKPIPPHEPSVVITHRHMHLRGENMTPSYTISSIAIWEKSLPQRIIPSENTDGIQGPVVHDLC